MQLWSLIGASWKSNISLNGLKSWHIGFSCIFVFCEHSSLANIVPSTMVMTPTIDVNDIISIKCKPAQIHYWHQWIRLWMKAFQSWLREQKWRISTRIFCLMRCCSWIIDYYHLSKMIQVFNICTLCSLRSLPYLFE